MSLYTEIYNFFNEGRPRTTNKGVEDIERPGSGRRQRDTDLYGKDKKVTSRLGVNPEGLKSTYKPGAVHEIRFNNVTKGVAQAVYTIYRSLSEEDYKVIKSHINPKVIPLVIPSNEENHEIDVYYITIPKMKYGKREGAAYTYFVRLKKDAVASLTDEQKNKIKLKLIPLKDISAGIDKRPLDLYTLMSFLTDEQKNKILKKRKTPEPKKSADSQNDAELLDIDLGFLADMGFDDEDDFDIDLDTPKEDPEEIKKAKQQAASFMLDDKVERVFTQIIKNYDVAQTPSTPQKEKKEANDKYSDMIKRFTDLLFDMTKNKLERESVIDYTVKQKLEKKPGLYKLIKVSYENMKSIKESLRENTQINDEEKYKVSVKYDNGRATDGTMTGKSLKTLIASKEFVYNKDIPFEKVVDDPKRGMQSVKGTLKIMTPIKPDKERNLVLKGRRTPEGDPIYGDPSKKEPTKDKGDFKTLRTHVSGQGGRSYKVPVNMGVKMADIKPNQLRYKYYVINDKTKDLVNGSDDWKETKEKAKNLGPDFLAVQRAALTSYGVNIYEELTDKDAKDIKSKLVSFTIESDPKNLEDPDTTLDVSGKVDKATFNKEKNELVLTLDNGSQAFFVGTKGGNINAVYDLDPTDESKPPRKINDIKEPLKSVLDKVFPSPAAESKLESYIRKRIKQALKEAEIDKYIKGQGPEVKKNRLEEYMKRYEWGFQESEDPYVRGTGAEKHAIVNKLVHELGDEGVAIFNSYAPKGQEISRPDDLNDMADTPLGSQLYQPYDPNSLTARGGRIAEEDLLSRSKYKGSGEDKLDDLVKNSQYDKLRVAIKAKPNAAAAKDLISIFRNTTLLSKDVSDDAIYQKFKSL